MKRKRIKSAIPIYLSAAVWLLLGLICPGMLLKGWFLAVAALLSIAVYVVSSRRRLSRNRRVCRRASSVVKRNSAVLDEGRKRGDSLQMANDAIPDTAPVPKSDHETDMDAQETTMAGNGPIDNDTMDDHTAQAGS